MFSHFTILDHQFFIDRTSTIAALSHDLRTKTAAAIVNSEKKIIGLGTNKLPFKINQDAVKMFQDQTFLDYFNTTYKLTGELAVHKGMIQNPAQLVEFFNRKPYKYTVMQHAERNAICNTARGGYSTRNTIMYASLYPCVQCANMIIDSGIKLLVVQDGPDYNDPISGPQWGLDWKTAEKFLKLGGVETIILGKNR